jgi:hypothetical protein
LRRSLVADHLNAARGRFLQATFPDLLTEIGFDLRSAAVLYLAACREFAVWHRF